MQKNVGNYEAAVRGVIGAGTLALAVAHRNPVWLLLSAMFFGTALSRQCMINKAFDISSYSDREGGEQLNPQEEQKPTIH
ncbi:MAG: DUF2892 domain-containing protein [Bdellovibrionota bacterium]